MLPSLILLCAMTGSRRVSLNDVAALLIGGLALFMVAFLRCSSSMARLFRLRMKKNSPPMIPAIARTPTTTPAAMPATLGLLDDEPVGVGVTVGVTVTTLSDVGVADDLVDVVDVAVEDVVEDVAAT